MMDLVAILAKSIKNKPEITEKNVPRNQTGEKGRH